MKPLARVWYWCENPRMANIKQNGGTRLGGETSSATYATLFILFGAQKEYEQRFNLVDVNLGTAFGSRIENALQLPLHNAACRIPTNRYNLWYVLKHYGIRITKLKQLVAHALENLKHPSFIFRCWHW